MGEKDWTKQAEEYDKIIHHEYIFTPAFKNLVETLKLQNKKILDIGCGAGEQSKILGEEYDCDVTGVDVSKNMINRAKRETKSENIKYEVKDAKNLEYKGGEFDGFL